MREILSKGEKVSNWRGFNNNVLIIIAKLQQSVLES
jgi:hypothetical protein